MVVSARFCMKSPLEHCTAWSRAPVQLAGARNDLPVWNDRDLLRRVAYADSTGMAVFECVPNGKYAVSALWVGKLIRERAGDTLRSSRGSGELDDGWDEVQGDSVIVAGAETRSTVVRRFNWGSRYLYR